MTVITDFALPESASSLALPKEPSGKFFIAFLSSPHPETNEPWCPDVRVALPHLKAAFAADDGPEVAFVNVGQRPEWREPGNVYRTKWNVHYVPTLVRFHLVDGQVKEVGRLEEGELLDETRLKDLVSGNV